MRITEEIFKNVLERIENLNDNPKTDDSYKEMDDLIQEIKIEFALEVADV